MPNKIKITLTLVAIVAVFSVYELAQYVHTIANGNSTFQQGTPLPSPDDDPDHDGLTNQQEIIWGTDPFNPDTDGDGFKDGEEVKSGHNPLVPGPDDLIVSDNLTQQFSDLAVSGMIAGDLQPNSTNYNQAVDQVTSNITDSSKYLFTQEITTEALTIVDTTKSANERYALDSMNLIKTFVTALNDQYSKLPENLDTIGTDGFDNQKLNEYYTAQGVQYASLLKEGLGMSTPKVFAPAQAKLASLIQRMEYISEAIRDGKKDPVKATLAFDALGGMYDSIIDFATLYDQAITSNGLSESTNIVP